MTWKNESNNDSEDRNALPADPNGPNDPNHPNDPPPPETPPQSWEEWFFENNPLYLLSVLLMFSGLLLVSRASQDDPAIGMIVGFFGVQNLYEIVMLGMGLYLLKHQINKRHGLILLAFGLLFLADVTFYQARITAIGSTHKMTWVPTLVSAMYLLLAAVKLAVVVKYLRFSIRWEQLAFPILSFGLIYFAPNYFMSTVYNLDNPSILSNDQYPQWVLYQICLLAALIQIPVIVGSWRKSAFQESVANPFIDDENLFYRAILLFPFIVLPIQFGFNIFTDERLQTVAILPNLIPYLICGIFFLESLIRSFIQETWGMENYDFSLAFLVFCLALLSNTNVHEFAPVMYKINLALILIAHVALTITRKNSYSSIFLLGVFSYLAANEIMGQAKKTYQSMKEISLVTWASILMAGSFILLGLGFITSLRGKKRSNP